MTEIRVQDAAFAPGAELDRFTDRVAGAGAVVSFSGVVRDDSGTMSALEIEHYPGMTERALAGIAAQAEDRWTLGGILILHRYGRIDVGAPIMMVATASRHRADAFASAEFLMDYLKSRAPFWKREIGADGTLGDWVEAKDHDEDALARWEES